MSNVPQSSITYYSGDIQARRELAKRQMQIVLSSQLTPFSLFQCGLFRTEIQDDKRYVNMIDVMAVFSGTNDDPAKYWFNIKRSLIKSGSDLSSKIRKFKMVSEDGKFRPTDCMTEDDTIRMIWKLNTRLAERFAESCVKWMRGMANLMANGDLERIEELYRSEPWDGIEARKLIGRSKRT